MLDIRKTRQIRTADGEQVTVYRDQKKEDKWYAIPEPVIAEEDGVPQFSLTRFRSPKGDVHGSCSFEVELQIRDAVVDAMKKNLGGDIKIGQLDWKTAQTWFYYSVNGEKKKLVTKPAMFGANRASFVVELGSQAELKAFKDAFGPGGSKGGTFQVKYDLTCLARLPDAKVTVDFDSSTAYHYSKTVQVSKDVWGHVTSRTAQVHQYLKESQAGTVKVEPGDKQLSQKTKQRLQSWGEKTLRADVKQAVDDTMRMIGEEHAENFSIEKVSSFHDVYKEGQVVSWRPTPQAMLDNFDESTWDKLYSEVDNRQLELAISVAELDAGSIEAVEVTIDYPTKKKGNTHKFTPENNDAWTYRAPGHFDSNGEFDPSYVYRYTVHYTDGTTYQPKKPRKTHKSELQLDLGDLAVLDVTFDASKVNFQEDEQLTELMAVDGASDGVSVEYIKVDFFFCNDSDNQVKKRHFQLEEQNPKHTVNSRIKRRASNPYEYKLTYVLSGGEKLHMDWCSDNADSVLLGDPSGTKKIALTAGKVEDYEFLNVSARYLDITNDIQKSHSWSMTNPDKGDIQPWSFTAPDAGTFFLSYHGEYVEKSTGQAKAIQASKSMQDAILVDSGMAFRTIEFDPSLINWDKDGPDCVSVVVHLDEAAGESGQATSGKSKAGKKGKLVFKNGDEDSLYYSFSYFKGKESSAEDIPPPPCFKWEATYHFSDAESTVKRSDSWVTDTSTVMLPSLHS